MNVLKENGALNERHGRIKFLSLKKRAYSRAATSLYNSRCSLHTNQSQIITLQYEIHNVTVNCYPRKC